MTAHGMPRGAGPTAPTVQAVLASSSFLGGLPEAALGELVSRGHTNRYAKGETIFERDDPGESLMVILSGRIKIANITGDAREVALNYLGVGDIVGEIAVLDGGARTATASALEDSEVFVVFRRDLLPVLQAHPAAMLEIVQVLCEKLRIASAQVEDSVLDMTGRMARGLLRLIKQHGRRGADGVRIDIRLNQRELGIYTGLSRENVSRQLGALRERGVVLFDGGDITVLDEAALTAIADRAT
jgi:CRP/FNR family transcriptional regulator, cyclic AMP receptor protein